MSSILTLKQVVRRSCLSLGLVPLALMFVAGGASADDGAIHKSTQTPPIKLGSSGSSIELLRGTYCYSGTLGGLVENSNGEPHILSNNHILAENNNLPLGTSVVQASTGDSVGNVDPCNGGDPTPNIVGSLSNFVPIEFCKLAGPWIRCNVNTVDAAIALVGDCGGKSCVKADGEIIDIGPLDANTVTASLGMKVQKSGRTTGHTTGTVAAIDVEFYVCYGISLDECQQAEYIALFRNQVRVDSSAEQPFSAGGDSGAIIAECKDNDAGGCDNTKPPRAVGLLFAGGDDGQGTKTTFFNQMDEVLNNLSVAMVGCGSACFGGSDDDGGGTKGGGKGGGNGGGKPSLAAGQPAGLEIARSIRAQNAEQLLRIDGVVGTGVGVDKNGNAVIEVYVKNATLKRADDPIPTEIDGVAVKVIETGVIRAY